MYRRAFIFGASKCGLLGFAVTSPPPWKEATAPTRSGTAAAVLMTSDGKVYKINNQDAVTDHAGHKVTITGKMTDDSIHVDNVKM